MSEKAKPKLGTKNYALAEAETRIAAAGEAERERINAAQAGNESGVICAKLEEMFCGLCALLWQIEVHRIAAAENEATRNLFLAKGPGTGPR